MAQTPLEGITVKYPAAQSAQGSLPTENRPAAQSEHPVDPKAEDLPAAQATHSELPDNVEYNPSAHGAQLSAPVPENMPAGQF